MDSHAILTAEQAAQSLGCAVKTIEDRARSGDLPALLWGDGGWVFPAAAFYARVNELAIEQAETRRKAKQPKAVAGTIGKADKKKAAPALPTLDARPSPRREWRHSAAPSPAKTSP